MIEALRICRAGVTHNHAYVRCYLTTVAGVDKERNNFHSHKMLLREGERISTADSLLPNTKEITEMHV